jgi:hypothetical protein
MTQRRAGTEEEQKRKKAKTTHADCGVLGHTWDGNFKGTN